jgi:hypothetical protein
MAWTTPIKFTFYDPATNEVVKEYNQWFIPWELLKPAIHLIKSLKDIDMQDLTDEQIDSIASLIVEVFCHQFSTEDIKKYHASIETMMNTLEEIGNRSNGLMPNPIPKGN